MISNICVITQYNTVNNTQKWRHNSYGRKDLKLDENIQNGQTNQQSDYN